MSKKWVPSNLLVDLENYNNRFVRAKDVLGGGEITNMEVLSPVSSDNPLKIIKSEDEIKEKYKSDLARAGLKIWYKDTGEVAITPTGKEPFLSTEVFVSNMKNFLSYLDAIDKNNLTAGQIETLKQVARNFTEQVENVERDDEFGNQEDKTPEIMGNFARVVGKYQEFTNYPELTQAVAKLAEYREIAKGRYLREYLNAQRFGLLKTAGQEDSPSTWHKKYIDFNVEIYESQWEDALQIVEEMDSCAKEFQRAVIENLLKSLEYARKHPRQDLDKQNSGQMEEYHRIIDQFESKFKKIIKS